ncbi:MAG: thiamine pyrophosphate-requiring protein [Alphaproteobacteria bacterium]|nr:thiamine pyrophosphate-requiring protein [Alphaproteobacteria bacterium]
MRENSVTVTAGGSIFPRLKALGVDYVFANSGTDFPPIIEGLAQAAEAGVALPEALVMPYEHAAMGMAHGYYLVTGRPQAVMLHTNVGLANGAIGAINAACDNVPMILMSGRTPVMEEGRFGARTVPIGWGQEMRDQAALVREASKWEYELKFPEQVPALLDRAYAIANSTPKGPVYLSLPREVLCEEVDAADLDAQPSIRAGRTAADPNAIATLAGWLAEAEAPLVIAQRGAGDAETFAAFSAWAEDWGIAVCSWWATHLAIPTDHPCHVGTDPGHWLDRADVVVILDCLAPWMPLTHRPRPEAKIANIGPDPIFSRFPVRNFRSDLSIAGETVQTIPALIAAMDDLPRPEDRLDRRRRSLADASAQNCAAQADAAIPENGRITKAYVSRILGEKLEGVESSVFSELGAQLGALSRRDHRSWFQLPHSGGLGWSFPTALGAQLAEPERVCVATMGDGSYMFANPTACHQIAEALQLPVLVVVMNNRSWGAVEASVKGLYPEGAAVKSNRMPLTSLEPMPDFCKVAEASRAWARNVADPEQLDQAVDEALDVVRTERRCAVLDVQVV